MKFPFEITFKEKMTDEIDKCPTSEMLEFYKGVYERNGVDSVEIIDNSLIIKNAWIGFRIRPGLNWNRWNGVVSAKLEIVENGDKSRTAIYTFNVAKILIIGLIFGIGAGIIVRIDARSISLSFWSGLIIFGVMGILNWAIALYQHQLALDDFIHGRKFNNSKDYEDE
jgi:hypothetical protein